MARAGTLVSEIEVKVSADHFYDTMKGKKESRVHEVSPDHIHQVDVHEGDWETSGSVKQLTFAVGDTIETLKEKIEFDDENKKITYTVLEGDLMKHYKSYKVILHVTPKGEGSLVKWSFLYEKVDESAPEPTKYNDLLLKVTKDLEIHLLQA
ncbi:hypothetical protein L6164_005973 [Bauhinia variegata]|uniref:Uncharacterized protein n=1 Tax=Bauhinia variegata TaxID=167791 RepID=A0ACB9PTG3_BAUVA|nr:hypothetical protein L6164_005973 [Bauhinia variegata]